jgi:peptidyl-prolyl cis-trans isomerase SurA
VISDQEIEREIKARLGDSYSGREKTDSSDSVTLSQILLSREQHSSSELRSLLDKIESSLAAGADFGELARQYSEGPTAQTGGDLGAISWKDLDPKLRKMLRALEPGEVSKAWNTASSIQLFKRPASREQNLRDTALRAKIKKELEQEQASLELKDILENQIPTRHTIEELF